MNYLKEIAALLTHDFDSISEWEDVLKVKPTPHSFETRLYGAMVNTVTKDVWLRNDDGAWYQLQAKDRVFEHVAQSVLQRLRYLKLMRPSIAVARFDREVDCTIIENLN